MKIKERQEEVDDKVNCRKSGGYKRKNEIKRELCNTENENRRTKDN